MTRDVNKVDEYEKILKQAIDLEQCMELPPRDRVKLLGDFRTSIVFKFFGKAKALQRQSIIDIACDFYEKLLPKCTADVQVQCPWTRSPAALVDVDAATPNQSIDAATPNQSSQADDSRGLIEYDEQGNAVGVHRELVWKKGFYEGCAVREKKSGDFSKTMGGWRGWSGWGRVCVFCFLFFF